LSFGQGTPSAVPTAFRIPLFNCHPEEGFSQTKDLLFVCAGKIIPPH
jgi:hypothetical protein